MEELENFDEVADLLYDQKMEALTHIKDLLIADDYTLFRKAFIEHSQLNNIWKTRKCSTDTIQENNLLNEFKRELQLLWEPCQVGNTVDFEHVAQQLFDEKWEVLEEIKTSSIKANLLHFQSELTKSERIETIWKTKRFMEFRMEMMRLFESEKIQLDQNKLELLVQKLHENKEHNIAELFKNILIPKKIKQIIVKIQSHEKLNTIWKSNMLFFNKIKSILEKYIDFSDNNDPDVKKIIAELHVDHENGMKLIEKSVHINSMK